MRRTRHDGRHQAVRWHGYAARPQLAHPAKFCPGLYIFVSQVRSRFFFLREQCDKVLRSVMQTNMVGHLPDFLAYTRVEEPSRIVDFLKEVVESFHF